METILRIIKKIIPKKVFKFFQPYYHKALSYGANFFYGYPSNKLIVVGVTGTNGKSSTTHIIAKILESYGDKVGETSTVFFKIGEQEWLNDKKMTMLGKFALQKMIAKMVKVGCKYAVIETSSEGIMQSRHLGINYDILVFTNLTPEHIEAHGGFENYKNAKLKLFKHLEKSKHKKIDGRVIQKTIVSNIDDKHGNDFLNFKVDKKIGYSLNKNVNNAGLEKVIATDVRVYSNGSLFNVDNDEVKINLLGDFNVYNTLAGIAVAKSLGFKVSEIKKSLLKIKGIEGRMEIIDEGQDFDVIVDYAPEPASLKQAYNTILKIKTENAKLIHVLGSCGGGRDVARRPVLGSMAGNSADYVIVTNEDPYDDDPMSIINDVASGAIRAGKALDKDLFKILDRREAIKKAFALAGKNDLVLLTGKGSEQAMCVADGKKIPWDERVVAREELANILKK